VPGASGRQLDARREGLVDRHRRSHESLRAGSDRSRSNFRDRFSRKSNRIAALPASLDERVLSELDADSRTRAIIGRSNSRRGSRDDSRVTRSKGKVRRSLAATPMLARRAHAGSEDDRAILSSVDAISFRWLRHPATSERQWNRAISFSPRR